MDVVRLTKRRLPQGNRLFNLLLLPSQFVLAGVFFNSHHRLVFFLLIEELQALGDDLGIVLGLAAFPVFVFIGLQATFHKDQAAFLEVFLADLAKPAPSLDVDPLGAFLGLAILVFPAVADGQAKVADFLASGGVLALGVLAQAPDQLNAV